MCMAHPTAGGFTPPHACPGRQVAQRAGRLNRIVFSGAPAAQHTKRHGSTHRKPEHSAAQTGGVMASPPAQFAKPVTPWSARHPFARSAPPPAMHAGFGSNQRAGEEAGGARGGGGTRWRGRCCTVASEKEGGVRNGTKVFSGLQPPKILSLAQKNKVAATPN